MKPVAVTKNLRGASTKSLQASECSIGKAKHGYAKHLYRIRKQEHLDFLSGDLTNNDRLSQMALEAARLSHSNKRLVISSHEIKSALKQLNLCKH